MADKKAMSKALGAAFLNHQVEQLEKSAASRNWRASGNPQTYAKRSGANTTTTTTIAAAPKGSPRKKTIAPMGGVFTLPAPGAPLARRSLEDDSGHDADVVVVDASVLVHALHQIKRWCRDGRSEVLIVPLEALNTLDLLKKGTSPIAQRARAASRILEAQVGSNPRIRVQQDAAFVPWDTIAFPSPRSSTESTDATAPEPRARTATAGPETAQEWVRQTICCARWEIDDAKTNAGGAATPRTVRLAILAPDANAPIIATSDAAVSKHEPRAAGALVSHWAMRAGIDVLPIAPSIPNVTNGNAAPAAGADGPAPRRPRSNTTQSKRRPNSGGATNGSGTGGSKGGSLVERPAAALALEGIVGTGGGPGVIRVLARGERLDAGP